MEEKKVEIPKLSYEQLEQYASQISQQLKEAYARLQEMNMINVLKRLDYLFKVLDHEDFFEGEFTNNCAKEIVDIMTPPPAREKETEE